MFFTIGDCYSTLSTIYTSPLKVITLIRLERIDLLFVLIRTRASLISRLGKRLPAIRLISNKLFFLSSFKEAYAL